MPLQKIAPAHMAHGSALVYSVDVASTSGAELLDRAMQQIHLGMREHLLFGHLAVLGRRQHGAVAGHQQRAERTIPVRACAPRDREHLAHVCVVDVTRSVARL